MKYFLTACMLWFAVSAMAQDIPADEETGKAKYEGVNQVAGVSATDLFDRAIKWIEDFYPNPHGVIQTKNKEEGLIEGRARFKLNKEDKKGNQLNGGFVSYGFTIYMKDGRYKYVITDIRWENASAYDVTQWSDTEQNHYDDINYPKYIAQTAKYFDDLLAAMKAGLEDSGKKAADDW